MDNTLQVTSHNLIKKNYIKNINKLLEFNLINKFKSSFKNELNLNDLEFKIELYLCYDKSNRIKMLEMQIVNIFFSIASSLIDEEEIQIKREINSSYYKEICKQKKFDEFHFQLYASNLDKFHKQLYKKFFKIALELKKQDIIDSIDQSLQEYKKESHRNIKRYYNEIYHEEMILRINKFIEIYFEDIKIAVDNIFNQNQNIVINRNIFFLFFFLILIIQISINFVYFFLKKRKLKLFYIMK